MGDRQDRRQFLKRVAATSALLVSDRGLGLAQVIAEEAPVGPPVSFGVVGLGPRGREVLSALASMPSARVAAVCDTYAPALKKAAEIAPMARGLAEARALLDGADVEAVVLTTPTHLHRDLAVAALQAGKHVYCEAPLATSVEDARDMIGRPSAALEWRVAWRVPGHHGRTLRLGAKRPALSVSAPHGKAFRAEGRLQGHVLDPRRGEPAHRAVSACVSGPSSTLCDALSTALLVNGGGWRAELAARFPGYEGWTVPGGDRRSPSRTASKAPGRPP